MFLQHEVRDESAIKYLLARSSKLYCGMVVSSCATHPRSSGWSITVRRAKVILGTWSDQ